MQVPLQIHFHNMDPSPAIEAAIRERAKKLERFADHIVSCRVSVEAPHKHRHQGQLYRVVVDVRVPGSELVASRDSPRNHAHKDVMVAIRDAFEAARRQLQDYVRIQGRKVKAHEVEPRGTIRAIHPEEDYGWIATPDARDIYFHRNSVVNADFDELQVGLQVRFAEESGDKGPQASSVHLIGKHRALR